jgi:RNA polymerase sigma factor (TIGR02999 family)
MARQEPPLSADCDGTVSRLISSARQGDPGAAARLFPLVYAQLRGLARQRMSDERPGHTLQATALVHEAYLKLLGAGCPPWAGRRQFFFAAAEAMRQILIDHARARNGLKRGGGRKRVPLSVLDLAADEQLPEILALDEAISRLEKVSPDVAAVVRLRFYAGLSVDETAEALGVSPRTVKREWTYARARLFRELSDDGR